MQRRRRPEPKPEDRLIEAVCAGDAHALDVLLNELNWPIDACLKYADPHSRSPPASQSGWRLLHHAADSGHQETAELLIRRGAALNLPSSLSITPAMLAAYGGHAAVLALLGAQGVSLGLPDSLATETLVDTINRRLDTPFVGDEHLKGRAERFDGAWGHGKTHPRPRF